MNSGSGPRRQIIVRRVIVTVAMIVAFLGMASVFTPDRTRAGGLGATPRSRHDANANAADPHMDSVDPHEGLRSLGSVETPNYLITIFATDTGPRYSITDRITNQSPGVLLTADQVLQLLPEVQLPQIDFSATDGGNDSPLMLAHPTDPTMP